jgi:hypothetical protein
MLYKGGPKNYSKSDWMIVKVIVGLLVVTMIYGMITRPETTKSSRSSTSARASSEYVDAAKQAGYSGSDAEQVAAAAERLCNSTGEC